MKKTNTNTTQTNNNAKTNNGKKKKANVNRYGQKIRNWSAYNHSLKQRGKISIYVDEALVSGAFRKPRSTHTIGHPIEYADSLILLMLTVRELLHLRLRQTVGFMEDILHNMGIDWPLPDYTTLSRRMGKLDIDFCQKFQGKNVVLLIDSSGFKVFGEGEWKIKKHGMGYRRTWRETHIGVDFDSRNIISLINTKASTGDNTQLWPLVDQAKERHKDNRIDTVIGDGAYDAKDNYVVAKEQGIEFIAPPPVNAVEHLSFRPKRYEVYDSPGWEERNAVVRHIEEFGADGWMADVEYHIAL